MIFVAPCFFFLLQIIWCPGSDCIAFFLVLLAHNTGAARSVCLIFTRDFELCTCSGFVNDKSLLQFDVTIDNVNSKFIEIAEDQWALHSAHTRIIIFNNTFLERIFWEL